MKFGTVAVREAAGSILAHSVMAGGTRYRKGVVLSADDLDRLQAAGVEKVTIARLGPGDVGEDEAVSRLADALVAASPGLSRQAAFAGRANIHAERPGLVELDEGAVERLNSINPEITLATLPHLARAAPRSLVATAKIIAFGVPSADLEAAEQVASGIMALREVVRHDASLVITRTASQPARLLDKGRLSVATRLERLGIRLHDTFVVPHEPAELGRALAATDTSMVLVLTGSATSDLLDVGPEGLRQAGGSVSRFGIPVDPGNLLFHGDLGGRPVIGLPGCARSPALNGADWVLERLACGLEISDREFARMGIGGLLKESPSRPQPRAAAGGPPARPRIAAVILAQPWPARDLDGLVAAAQASDADSVTVVHAPLATGPEPAGSLAGCDLIAAAGDRKSDLLRAGIGGVPDRSNAVLLLRSGDPVPGPDLLNRMMAAFSPADGREICRAGPGQMGPPILLGSRFFEALSALEGDRGAAEFLPEVQEFVVEVEP